MIVNSFGLEIPSQITKKKRKIRVQFPKPTTD